MSKKGSSAPAPDPRLTEAQIKSMGYQDQMIQEMLANSRDLAPLQKQQLQFGLDSAKTAYDQSQEDRKWMLTRRNQLSGIQDQMVKDANDFNLEGRQDQLVDRTYADINEGYSNARAQGLRNMERMGVNPASGRMAALASQDNVGLAAARAGAASKVREAARAEGYALTDRANNALAGYPAMASGASGAGAGFGASGLNIVNAGLGGLNSGLAGAGTLAGQMGSNATNMWGAQGSYAANMNNSGGGGFADMAGGLGSLVGTGLKLYGTWASDERLKENIKYVGRDPHTKLPRYEFNYKGDRQRFNGYMAGDVAHHYPEAVSINPEGYAIVDYGMLGSPMIQV